jgi:Holliday junction resolvasome RuvABC endonuclease subunit
MYVGIDQSLTGFGITFLLANGEHQTIVKKFDPKKYGPGVTRLLAINDWLYHELRKHELDENIEHVCMEGYANGAKFGREQAGELGAYVKLTLFEALSVNASVEDARYPTIVKPLALKKFITGHGVAKKNEILLGVFRRWGIEFRDDNAADSYGLARIAEAIHTGKTEFQYERDVLENLALHTERPNS